jgi:hypothetical protein
MGEVSYADGNPTGFHGEVPDSTNIPVKDAVKLYKKAILWAFAISLGPVMEGYDVVLLGSFFGLQEFADKCVGHTRVCL